MAMTVYARLLKIVVLALCSGLVIGLGMVAFAYVETAQELSFLERGVTTGGTVVDWLDDRRFVVRYRDKDTGETFQAVLPADSKATAFPNDRITLIYDALDPEKVCVRDSLFGCQTLYIRDLRQISVLANVIWLASLCGLVLYWAIKVIRQIWLPSVAGNQLKKWTSRQ